MAVSRYEMTTPKGYPLDEVTSALQKEIRRGNAVAALYWARELIEKYHKYLWRRLEIICAEDIGIANPQAIVVVKTLGEVYLKHKDESQRGNPDGNILAMAILYMCRSPKNRSGDNLWGTTSIMSEDPEFIVPIPEYALDGHTKRGRAALGSLKKENPVRWWFKSASRVTPETRDEFIAKNLAWLVLNKPDLVVETKEMLQERFGDDFEYYDQEMRHWVETLKPLHPAYASKYTEEERNEALQALLYAQ